MARERLYKKLPGVGRKFLSAIFYRLYLGPDHLMQVESNRMTEKYRRFYYSDIQGIAVRKTKNGAIAFTVLLLIALSLAGVAWQVRVSDASWITLGVIALAVAVASAFVLWRGPTCRTHLFTAVSNEPLPSLNRLRSVRKFVARLTPLVESAQGGALDPADYAVGVDPFESTLPPPGRAGAVIFAFLATTLIEAALLALHAFASAFSITLAAAVVLLAGVVLAILALIQASRRKVRRGLIGALWAGAVFFGTVLAIGYVAAVLAQMQNPSAVVSLFETLGKIAAQSASHAYFQTALLALALCGLCAGLAGLFFTRVPARP